MDPDAALEFIVEALREGNLSDAGMAMEDLQTWLRRGGFPPKNPELMAEFLEGIMNQIWPRTPR